MIPVVLKLEHFLSWKSQTIDFRGFTSACLCGDNGDGKSALLSAIPFAFYGHTYPKNLIRDNAANACVTLIFELDSGLYRIVREVSSSGKHPSPRFEALPADLDGDADRLFEVQGTALGGSVSETNDEIKKLLGLDKDAFVTSSFLRQGEADEFMLLTDAKRREHLRSILGLEIWDQRRERAHQEAKSSKKQMDVIDPNLEAYHIEANTLAQRDTALKAAQELEATSNKQQSEHRAQLDSVTKDSQALEGLRTRQKDFVEQCRDLQQQKQSEVDAIEGLSQLIQHKAEILKNAEEFNQVTREHEELRDKQAQMKLLSVKAEQAATNVVTRQQFWTEKLTLLRNHLDGAQSVIATAAKEIETLEKQIATAVTVDTDLEEASADQESIRKLVASPTADQHLAHQTLSEAQARLVVLRDESGPCPLCNGDLSSAERKNLITKTKNEVNETEIRIKQLTLTIENAESRDVSLTKSIKQLRQLKETTHQQVAALAQQTRDLEKAMNAREEASKQIEVSTIEQTENLTVLQQASEVANREVTAVGYNHDRHTWAASRLKELHSAQDSRARLSTAETEAAARNATLSAIAKRIEAADKSTQEISKDIETVEAKYPEGISHALGRATELVGRAKDEATHVVRNRVEAELKLKAAQDAKQSAAQLEGERETHQKREQIFEALKVAFARIPHLILDNGVRDIQTRASQFLAKLTESRFAVEFRTSKPTKDGATLKDGLEIIVYDDNQPRLFEHLSGGEKHRVAVAVRLALSESLATRNGARINTLVIDEGFGTQDAEGRRLLIDLLTEAEANSNFRKILVVSHMQDVQDEFQSRIEITKDSKNGSNAKVTVGG